MRTPNILVNPAPGKKVMDMNGRDIIECETGTKVPPISFYNKLIKEKALTLVKNGSTKKSRKTSNKINKGV